MTGQIFLNYRRGDDAGTVGRLFDQLEQVFGADKLFMDVEGRIRAGDDYVDVLRAQVAACDVLLAVIGPRWLTVADDTGRRRLDNPEDWVRVEIASALEAGTKKRVIPVLVPGGEMPRAEDLPPDLAALVRKQAVRITLERFRSDTQGLVSQITGVLADVEAARAVDAEQRAKADAALRQRAVDEAARQEAVETRAREQRAAGMSAEDVRKAEELANWNFIRERSDVDDLRDHLARFAGGLTERYAQARLAEMVWAELDAFSPIEQLSAFVEAFPQSDHADQAKLWIGDAEGRERAAAEARTQETRAWAAVAASTDAAAIKAFLEAWPGGAHAVDAKDRLKEIRGTGVRKGIGARTATMADAQSARRSMSGEELKVIAAASAGTIFQWYDFYLYGSLAAVIGAKFFAAFDANTRTIFALLAFAAGFFVRPFGSLFFGRLGDSIGRKATLVITMLIMGVSTLLIAVLPDYNSIGWIAPVLLIALRMAQGFALGGEYGGAAVYIAEHAPPGRRGFYTSWIQTTATLGLLLSMLVIIGLRLGMGEEAFQDTGGKGYELGFLGLKGGWRIPFFVSIILLAISVIIRLTLNESPAFQRMKEEGTASQAPLSEAFGSWDPPFAALLVGIGLIGTVAGFLGYGFWALLAIPVIILLIAANMARNPNGRIVVLALVGLVAGQAVVWYTGQFYALFFLAAILKADLLTASSLVGWSLIIGTPFFLVFGALSDRIGRRSVILAGCLIAALTYFPLFHALTSVVNPQLEKALDTVRVEIIADPGTCGSVFDPVGIRAFTAPCDTVRRALVSAAIPYKLNNGAAGSGVKVAVNGTDVAVDKDFFWKVTAAANAVGFPKANDPGILKIYNPLEVWTSPRAMLAVLILTIMVIYVAMVYGPIAAALVDFFPTRIRYTAVSLPYHIGNGWVGGMLPATSFAMVASTGDIYYGLWYPVGFALLTFVIGLLFIRDPGEKNMDVRH